MHSSNVQGFVRTVPTLYVVGACTVEFLHYVLLYRNTKHYATLNCSLKTLLSGGCTEKMFLFVKNCFFSFTKIKTFFSCVTCFFKIKQIIFSLSATLNRVVLLFLLLVESSILTYPKRHERSLDCDVVKFTRLIKKI